MSLIKNNVSFRKYSQFVENMNKKLNRDPIHKKHTIKILRYLALNGESSVKIISKKSEIHNTDEIAIRTVRKIFSGRTDRGNHSPGLEELGAINKIPISKMRSHFELSLFGLLLSIKLCNFTTKELHKIAKINYKLLPSIFVNHKDLFKNGVGIKPLKTFAEGDILKLELAVLPDTHFQELFTYLNSFFPKTVTAQEEFEHFIFDWFYTYLLWYSIEEKKISLNTWKKIVTKDRDTRLRYTSFVIAAQDFYLKRHHSTKQFLEKYLN